MTKHTPGPWQTAQNCDVETPFGHAVAYTAKSHEQRANARMIAAAPELLEALRDCVTAYEEHRDGEPTGHLWPDPNHICRARATIAKAEGSAV